MRQRPSPRSTRGRAYSTKCSASSGVRACFIASAKVGIFGLPELLTKPAHDRGSRPDQRPSAPAGPAYVHNLPAHPRQMVGREQAVRDISEKLRAQRFVTIIGPIR